jgi:hypothetical protein
MNNWNTASPMKKLLHSRKFLILCLDTVISLITFVVGMYFLNAQETTFFIIATIQPIFIFIIGAIAYEDVHYIKYQNGK